MYDRPIFTVVTPAESYDLTTVAIIKARLNLEANSTNDAFLAGALSGCSTLIANYCNRVFQIETVQDVFYARRYEPRGRREEGAGSHLQLTRWPVTAITSVVETDASGNATTLVEGTDFILDAARGRLVRLGLETALPRPWWMPIVTAQYSAGYATIPADIVGACLIQVTADLTSRGQNPRLRSEGEPGLGQQQYWIGTLPGQNGALAPEVESRIANYRVPVIA